MEITLNTEPLDETIEVKSDDIEKIKKDLKLQ